MEKTIVEKAVQMIQNHPANIEVFIEQINTVPVNEFDTLAELLVQKYVQVIPMLFPALTKARKEPKEAAQKLLLFWERYTDALDDVVRTAQPFLLETVADVRHLLENTAGVSGNKEYIQRIVVYVYSVLSTSYGEALLREATTDERTHIRIALRHIWHRIQVEPEVSYIQSMINQLDDITS